MDRHETMQSLPAQGVKVCPICGNRAYSPGGIHPQCAAQQADERQAAELKALGTEGEVKSELTRWNRKECPACGARLHVRRKFCDCGHDFKLG